MLDNHGAAPPDIRSGSTATALGAGVPPQLAWHPIVPLSTRAGWPHSDVRSRRWIVRTHDRIIVTRNGCPAAVLISPEELESLEDTLELLSDPDAMR